MAKSISADKRENEKKRLARRAEKQKKKEEKKLSNKANSFEDMIAYVDKNGMITSTPPAENTPKEEIKLEEIVISTPKKIRKNRSSAEDVSSFSMNRKASASSRTYPGSKNTFSTLTMC